MKKLLIILSVSLMIILVSCDNAPTTTNTTLNITAQTTVETTTKISTTELITTVSTTEETNTTTEEILSEEELVAMNELFQQALPMAETFVVNGIEATIDSALTSIAFIGNNFNLGMMGVYIYIDYDESATLKSEWFTVIDVYGNTYTHITADGLDTLGDYRNHHDIGLGYYRVSLPDNLTHFLLRYGEEGNYTYIHFTVEEGY